MSTDDNDRSNLMIKDSKGYSCKRCRQRFPATINVSKTTCHACRRVSGGSDRTGGDRCCNSKENCRVARVVEKLKTLFSGNHQDRFQDKPKSLNCVPVTSEPRSTSSGPRKRALLIGVTYTVRKYKLKGTVNDVKNMRNFLMDSFKFHEENIRVLTEEETDAEFIPTKKNIVKWLNWLVEDCQAGDSLVFYFSGHGIRQPDFKGDELDGFDETICPVDFLQEGMILDNDINSTIVWPLPRGVTLHAIVDACHSGTILDLVHVYDIQLNKWKDNYPPNNSRKQTDGGLAISISACKDNQMAADTTAFGGKGMNGALTYILIEIVRAHPAGLTYFDLMDMISETIHRLNSSGCRPLRFLRAVLHNNLLQTTILSASEPFDVKTKHFIL